MRPCHVTLRSEVLQSGLRQGLRVCFQPSAHLPRRLPHLADEILHEAILGSLSGDPNFADSQP